LQNSPLESSCVVIALIALYSTSKPLSVSPEKLQILSCDTVVANGRYIFFLWYNMPYPNLGATNDPLQISDLHGEPIIENSFQIVSGNCGYYATESWEKSERAEVTRQICVCHGDCGYCATESWKKSERAEVTRQMCSASFVA
jgi:hypothetical protein